MTTDAAIRVDGLEKSYDHLHVLRGVDLEVERGTILIAAYTLAMRTYHRRIA